MSKSKRFANLILVISGIVAFGTSASAQNNLTAKANSILPPPVSAAVESDRVRDGLVGPVRRVRTEVAKLSNTNGRPTEDKRVLLETASYDIKGGKTENQYFPVAGSALTGKEVYKYDEKGNISEMMLLNTDGSLLGREVYKYDYDFVGNWTKMTTSVAVLEGGKVTFEPSEVTYRLIMYYLDGNMLKMAQPPANSEANSSAAKMVAVETKSQPVETKSQPIVPAASKSPPVKKPAGNSALGTNHKAGPSLPAVHTATNQANALSSTELTGIGTVTNSGKGTIVVLDSEPPTDSMPKPLLKPVSGGVLNGKALNLPAPIYPDAAKRMRTAGTVTVEVLVDENGKVMSAQATSGPQLLRDPAVQAALKAKFSSTKLSGQPVKVTGLINYKFSLSQ